MRRFFSSWDHRSFAMRVMVILLMLNGIGAICGAITLFFPLGDERSFFGGYLMFWLAMLGIILVVFVLDQLELGGDKITAWIRRIKGDDDSPQEEDWL